MEINAKIIFCDNIVSNASNNKIAPCISKPLKNITPRNIPGNYTFSIFVSVENVSQEYKELEVAVYDTQNIKVFYTGVLKLDAFNKNNNVYSAIILTADLRNVIIERPGCFTAKILLDGQSIAEGKLEVKSKI